MASSRLRDHSYFQTGGTCDELIIPRSVDDVCRAMAKLSENKTPYFILGGGTNSLVSDEHWSGAVLVLTEMNDLKLTGSSIYVGCGVENSVFSRFAHSHNLSGAEFMNRLPGRMGGTVRMNARCYGGEISQIVRRVFSVSPKGEKAAWQGKDVFRGYKDTTFMTNQHIVVGCDVELVPGDSAEIAKKMAVCENDRLSKHQFDFPSCGCVFKNDYGVGVPSGVLLEKSGVKSLTVGGATISPYHANFVFNKGGSSRDVLELSIKMREAVWANFGVWLEYEMEVLGLLPMDLKPRLAEMRENKPKADLLAPLQAAWAKK